MKAVKSDEFKEKFLETLAENGGHVSATCEKHRIARWTYYRWCKEDEEFGLKAQEIAEGILDNVESSIYKSALEGNVTAQIFILKTKAKNRGYVERYDNFNVNMSVGSRDLDQLEGDDLDKEIKRLERAISIKET